MQSFFSDPGGVGREVAIRSLRRDIVGLIGGPARLHDALFLDAAFADFFASDDEGRLYIIRWIDGQDFAPVFTHTVGEVVRLNEAGRAVAARIFELPDDFPTPTLVLVSDRIEEDWVRLVSALRIPVILLRAHSLVDGTRHSAGCLFEKCYASPAPSALPSRPAMSAIPRSDVAPRGDAGPILPRAPGFPSPTADLRLAAVDPDEPVESLDAIQPHEELDVPLAETLLERQERSTASALAAGVAIEPAGKEGNRPGSAKPALEESAGETPTAALEAGPRAPAPAAQASLDGDGLAAADSEVSRTSTETWAAPRALLTDEEAATFRLLESMLESRN